MGDGKRLEALVAFVERTLLPEGFTVKANECVYNDEGIQIAEFDIEIRGRVGTTDIAWLIECRDRPQSGSAPGSWIEQLVGRHRRFGFNKVTAVSTTGFAAGAVEFAEREGIELREVKSLELDAFEDWLKIRTISQVERIASLLHAGFEAGAGQPKLATFLANHLGDLPFLANPKTNEVFSAAEAFVAAVQNTNLFDGLQSGGPARKVLLDVLYPDGDRLVVETREGPVTIAKIMFRGELSIRETQIPLVGTAVYKQATTEEHISEVATFAPQTLHGRRFSLEFHRLQESGETHVILRPNPDEDK